MKGIEILRVYFTEQQKRGETEMSRNEDGKIDRTRLLRVKQPRYSNSRVKLTGATVELGLSTEILKARTSPSPQLALTEFVPSLDSSTSGP